MLLCQFFVCVDDEDDDDDARLDVRLTAVVEEWAFGYRVLWTLH